MTPFESAAISNLLKSLTSNNSRTSRLTFLLLLLELVLLLAVLLVILRQVGVGRLVVVVVVVSVVRRRGLARAVQPGELGGADLLGAGSSGSTPRVLRPPLLRGAAAGGQEALCHGCSALLRPLAAGGITSHLPGTTHAMDKEGQCSRDGDTGWQHLHFVWPIYNRASSHVK